MAGFDGGSSEFGDSAVVAAVPLLGSGRLVSRIAAHRTLLWVSSLYFCQGLPYAIVTLLSVVMYKNFGVSNAVITFYTSLLVMPWSIKPLWAPLLEYVASRRQLVLFCQAVMSLLLVVLALSLNMNHMLIFSGLLFLLLAVFSATHDISSDGAYLVNLDAKSQARYVGVRSFFYGLARIFCQGPMLILAGVLMEYYPSHMVWQWIFFLLAIVLALMAGYHYILLPKDVLVDSPNRSSYFKVYADAFQDFITTPHLIIFLVFLFLFNFPEAQLIKIAPLFLLDHYHVGGLQLDNIDVGFVLGCVGVLAMLVGAVLSGWMVARWSLKTILPKFAILVGLTHLSYLYLAYEQPHNLLLIALCIGMAQFSFGLSNSAYMAYLLHKTVGVTHKMSYYAFGTAVMAAGMMVGGAISGMMQSIMGYSLFFIWILIAGAGVVLLAYALVYKDASLTRGEYNECHA